MKVISKHISNFSQFSDEKLAQFINYLNNDALGNESRMRDMEGWASSAQVKSIFRECIAVLLHLGDNIIELGDTEEGLKKLQVTEIGSDMSEEAVKKGFSVIKAIAPKLEPFFLFKKKAKLAELFDKPRELNMIVEMRPVYNLKRTAIHDMLFPVIINVRFDDASKNVKFELDEAELLRFRGEIDIALQKLKLAQQSRG